MKYKTNMAQTSAYNAVKGLGLEPLESESCELNLSCVY